MLDELPDRPCNRCHEDILAKHPNAWALVEVSTPMDASLDRSLLCAECMTLLGEFLVPELKGDPAWESGKDQLFALIKDRMNGRL